MIPKKQSPTKNKHFDTLKVGGSHKVGVYTRLKCQELGSIVSYYNRVRSPKQFCQRTVNGCIHIFRDNDKLTKTKTQ